MHQPLFQKGVSLVQKSTIIQIRTGFGAPALTGQIKLRPSTIWDLDVSMMERILVLWGKSPVNNPRHEPPKFDKDKIAWVLSEESARETLLCGFQCERLLFG